jgi:hypothetical protein
MALAAPVELLREWLMIEFIPGSQAGTTMKILFLHGWESTPGGLKPTYLKDHGHEILNPALPDDDFDAATRIARAEYDQGQPDVVVGSSRGGAVAMNIDSGDTPQVLLCPAWKTWGTAKTVKRNTTILHSRADETVPFEDSLELLKNSGLPDSALIEVGHEHRLADEESLATMLETVEKATSQQAAFGEWKYIRVAMVNDIPVVCFNDIPLAIANCEIADLGQELLSLADQRQCRTLILDFEGRPFFTCTVFSVDLIGVQSKLKGKLMLCNLNPLVAEVFKVFGRDNRYGHIFPTREDALKASKASLKNGEGGGKNTQ